MRMYEWIRKKIEDTPGLTQTGLSERLGLNPSAINRMLHGNRNIMAWEVPVIEEYLGARFAPEVLTADARDRLGQKQLKGFGEGEAAPLQEPYQDNMDLRFDKVPVYGQPAGVLDGSLNLAAGEVADWAVRHPHQQGVTGAFALYVFCDVMAPRYAPGELVYVHPGRPPESGKDCVVELKTGDAFLYRYKGQTEKSVTCTQLNPQKDIRLAKSKIKSLYAVVGRG